MITPCTRRFRQWATASLVCLVVFSGAGIPGARAAGLPSRPSAGRDGAAITQLVRARQHQALYRRYRALNSASLWRVEKRIQHIPATWHLEKEFAEVSGGARTEMARGLAAASRPATSTSSPGVGPPSGLLVCNGRPVTIAGTAGDDVIYGTPGRDVIAGLGGNDEIHGLGQNDIICGGPGDDVILGDGGDDTIFGDDGNDVIDGGAGNDTMDGGAGDFDGASFFNSTGPVVASLSTGTATGQGSDKLSNVEVLHGSPYGDHLAGDAGNNLLFGNGGDDTLFGGGGDDSLSGGAGNDTIDGGDGAGDLASFWDATGPVTASLVTGVSRGGGGTDTFTNVEGLSGGPYDDSLTGDAGDNFILGDAGNDTLIGGDGNDGLNGGPGDDTMDGGGQEFDAATFFDETGSVTASLATGTATGEGADRFSNVNQLHGGDFSDTFFGNAGNNTLFGNGGNDILAGGDGDDTLSGGLGDDTLDGGSGFDEAWFIFATGPVTASLVTGVATGGGGTDHFTNIESLGGGDYGDTLVGDGGDNGLSGFGGDDTLIGGDGNDFLDGGDGNDTMDGGGQEFDAVAFFDETGPVTASLITGTASGQGSDTFTGVAQLHGGDFSDTFTGDDGNNALFGNGGSDFLSAGAGDDTVSGGLGDDFIDGGPGIDVTPFFFASGPVYANLETGVSSGGEGNDVITGVEMLDGTPFDDTLIGDAGDNTLSGEGGDDTLIGGAGNDFLVPGAGRDTVDAGPGDSDAITYRDAGGPITASLATGTATGDGDDVFTNIEQIHGSPFDDHLSGGSVDGNIFGLDGNDTILGGSGNEFLFGNNGDDTIYGGDGDDFLAPGSGSDTLDGGQGFDKAAYWDAPGPITASLVAGSATGDGDDTLVNIEGIHGSGFADAFAGDGANNELFGLDGNDTLYGGDGNDVLIAGNGDDTVYGGDGDDYIDGEDGFDVADGGPGGDFCINVESSVNCEAP